MRLRTLAASLIATLAVAAPAAAAPVLVSVASGPNGDLGLPGDGEAYEPAVSADARFVAFTSTATDLHPDDEDIDPDVFVRDLQLGTTTLVSRASGAEGAPSNGSSGTPSLTADGRHVAFLSDATNLHDSDTTEDRDVFVRDLADGSMRVISPTSDDLDATEAVIAAGGGAVAFTSEAQLASDEDVPPDVFRAQFGSGTELVSRGGSEDFPLPSAEPTISAGGRVAFVSYGALNPDDDTQGSHAIYSFREIGPGGPFNGAYEILLQDRTVFPQATAGHCGSQSPSLSGDGNTIAFSSNSADLDLGPGPDPNSCLDWPQIFMRGVGSDRGSVVISRTSGADGEQGDEGSYDPSVSEDGRYVAFTTVANNLRNRSGGCCEDGVVVRDTRDAVTIPVAAPPFANQPAITPDGRWVALTARPFGDQQVYLSDVLGPPPAPSPTPSAPPSASPTPTASPSPLPAPSPVGKLTLKGKPTATRKRISVTVGVPQAGTLSAGAKAGKLLVGSATRSVTGARPLTLTLQIRRRARKALRNRRLRTRITVSFRPTPDGVRQQLTARLTLPRRTAP